MIFEMNEGQSDPQVKALARGSKYGLFLTSDESVFVLDPGAKDQAVVRLQAIGANPAPHVSGVDRLDSTSNYYVGNDQSKWRRNVAHYARVKYDSIYPGVDLVYYGNQQQLEYDYVVTPGADPNSIQLAVDGARKLRIDNKGDLVLQTAHGALYHHKPVIYQDVNGTRREIAGSFLLHGNLVSFRVGDYDHSKDLVIDPSLVFLSYLGGSGTDEGKAITITTGTGFMVVAGSTASANFPIVAVPKCPATPVCTNNGVTSYPYTGESDGFLAVLYYNSNTSSTHLLNSTFVGGTGGVNAVTSVAIDPSEVPAVLYVAGYTTSPNFAVSANAAQPKIGGGTDGWIAQILLNVTITSFIPPQGTLDTSVGFATYLGGSATDVITGVAIDPNTLDAFVTGYTKSTNFPVTLGVLQSKFGGTEDAFVARYASGISPETTKGGTVLFSTYYGASGAHVGNGIAVSTSTSIPTTAYVAGTKTVSTGSTAFLGAINGTGTASVFSESIGSATTKTKGTAVTVDANGDVYFVGSTNDSVLATVNAIQSHYKGGGSDAFVGAYNSSGAAKLLTYWGGSGFDVAQSVGTFLSGTNINLFFAGYTTGGTTLPFPVLNAVQPTYGGGATDGFVAMFSSTNSGSTWGEGYSTFLGGTGADAISGLVVGTSGNARVTGYTNSPGIAKNGYQSTLGGGIDAFLAEIQTTP